MLYVGCQDMSGRRFSELVHVHTHLHTHIYSRSLAMFHRSVMWFLCLTKIIIPTAHTSYNLITATHGGLTDCYRYVWHLCMTSSLCGIHSNSRFFSLFPQTGLFTQNCQPVAHKLSLLVEDSLACIHQSTFFG